MNAGTATLLAILTALVLTACFPRVDKGFGGGGSSLSDTADAITAATGDGTLTASHPGFEDACCADCHGEDAHNEGLLPHECAGCHGANGAPRGHTNETPCAECHSREHRCGDFPDPVSCQTCHAGTNGGGDDDDEDD